ncbi:hypothetical protein BDV09DRAFT_188318 [Aspergillus tetrazonus]
MAADERVSITAVSWTLVTLCRGWDDLFVTIALVPKENAIICSALTQIAVSHGLGKHEADIPDPNDRINAAKYTTIAPNFSVISTVTGKISVVIFLLRLLTLSVKPWQRWFLHSLTLASIAWNTLGIVAIIGYCRPTRKIRLPETDGSCMSSRFQLVAGISQSAFNAFADWALALFPAILFRKVQLPFLKKVVVIAVLGAGVLDMARHHEMVNVPLIDGFQRQQPKIWNEQMYLIIICASVPTMPQSLNALLHPCKTSQDSSLFDAPAEHTGSQENILARNEGELNTNIGYMMDLTVAQDSDRGEIVLVQGGTS